MTNPTDSLITFSFNSRMFMKICKKRIRSFLPDPEKSNVPGIPWKESFSDIPSSQPHLFLCLSRTFIRKPSSDFNSYCNTWANFSTFLVSNFAPATKVQRQETEGRICWSQFRFSPLQDSDEQGRRAGCSSASVRGQRPSGCVQPK